MNWRTYLSNNLLAWDEAVNVLLKGQVGETLSERACTARRDGRAWGCLLCRALEWVVPNHCEIALGNAFVRAGQIALDAGGDRTTTISVNAPCDSPCAFYCARACRCAHAEDKLPAILAEWEARARAEGKTRTHLS